MGNTINRFALSCIALLFTLQTYGTILVTQVGHPTAGKADGFIEIWVSGEGNFFDIEVSINGSTKCEQRAVTGPFRCSSLRAGEYVIRVIDASECEDFLYVNLIDVYCDLNVIIKDITHVSLSDDCTNAPILADGSISIELVVDNPDLYRIYWSSTNYIPSPTAPTISNLREGEYILHVQHKLQPKCNYEESFLIRSCISKTIVGKQCVTNSWDVPKPTLQNKVEYSKVGNCTGLINYSIDDAYIYYWQDQAGKVYNRRHFLAGLCPGVYCLYYDKGCGTEEVPICEEILDCEDYQGIEVNPLFSHEILDEPSCLGDTVLRVILNINVEHKIFARVFNSKYDERHIFEKGFNNKVFYVKESGIYNIEIRDICKTTIFTYEIPALFDCEPLDFYAVNGGNNNSYYRMDGNGDISFSLDCKCLSGGFLSSCGLFDKSADIKLNVNKGDNKRKCQYEITWPDGVTKTTVIMNGDNEDPDIDGPKDYPIDINAPGAYPIKVSYNWGACETTFDVYFSYPRGVRGHLTDYNFSDYCPTYPLCQNYISWGIFDCETCLDNSEIIRAYPNYCGKEKKNEARYMFYPTNKNDPCNGGGRVYLYYYDDKSEPNDTRADRYEYFIDIPPGISNSQSHRYSVKKDKTFDRECEEVFECNFLASELPEKLYDIFSRYVKVSVCTKERRPPISNNPSTTLIFSNDVEEDCGELIWEPIGPCLGSFICSETGEIAVVDGNVLDNLEANHITCLKPSSIPGNCYLAEVCADDCSMEYNKLSGDMPCDSFSPSWFQCGNVASGSCFSGNDETELRNTSKEIPVKKIDSSFKIYPNPFSNTFTLEIESSMDMQVDLDIFSSIGQRQHQSILNLLSGKNTFEMEALQDKPNGIYTIRLSSGSEILKVERVIKL